MSGTSLPPQPSSMSPDLQGDRSLQVEISDAVSERDKVKFTVQTKVRLRRSRGRSDGCFRSPARRCPRSLWARLLSLALGPWPSEKEGILSSLVQPLPA